MFSDLLYSYHGIHLELWTWGLPPFIASPVLGIEGGTEDSNLYSALMPDIKALTQQDIHRRRSPLLGSRAPHGGPDPPLRR